MQNPEPPTSLDSSHPGTSHYVDRGLVSSAKRPGLPAAYSQHCAPAADAAFERHAGRAMHIPALPPLNSLPPTPLGRRQEPVNSLVSLHPQFSPARSEQHSYPSPPMSDSHSPGRRSAHLDERNYPPYPPPLGDARRLDPPPPLPPFDHHSMTSAHSISHPRPQYPGEAPGPQPHQYQPGHAIESPHYGNMQLHHGYQYVYPPPPMPAYLGSHGPVPHGQQQAMIAPPPLRQSKPARRTKAHVAAACVNCKKAHLSCDVQRPCGRCVASSKQDTCKDVPHKKRGRPRLRDDKDFGRNEEGRPMATQILGAMPSSGTAPEVFGQQLPFSSTHRAPDPLRVLRTPTGEAETGFNFPPQRHLDETRQRSVGTYGGIAPSPYASGPNLPPQSLPIAFLNLDLVVLKSNQAFQDLLAFVGDVRGRSLMDLLEPRSNDVLHRIRSELREEREAREPTYMAPITPVGQDPLQSVPESDADQVSQGYTDRTFILNFRLPDGGHQSLNTQVRLAKTSLYFVTLVVHTPPRAAGPPLLTQHLAPPTPIGASQSMSAPTTAPVREFGAYPAPPASAGSAPTSPYFNFSSVRTSLPAVGSSSYGTTTSYNYSPTAGNGNGNSNEQGYFPAMPPPPQTTVYPSPYPPLSRNSSITSEPASRHEPTNREPDRAARLEGLQLPPIRGAPTPQLPSRRAADFAENGREQARPLSADRPDTPSAGKRRRLNLREVLE